MRGRCRKAYDEKLADRIRELLAGERGVSEKTMFGGLAFLVRGNMAIAASGQGGAFVRCDPRLSDALLRKTEAESMVMAGRQMSGWLRVPAEHLTTQHEIARWVAVATAYTRTLAAK